MAGRKKAKPRDPWLEDINAQILAAMEEPEAKALQWRQSVAELQADQERLKELYFREYPTLQRKCHDLETRAAELGVKLRDQAEQIRRLETRLDDEGKHTRKLWEQIHGLQFALQEKHPSRPARVLPPPPPLTLPLPRPQPREQSRAPEEKKKVQSSRPALPPPPPGAAQQSLESQGIIFNPYEQRYERYQ